MKFLQFGTSGQAVAPLSLSSPWLAEAGVNAIYYDGNILVAAGWTGPDDARRFALARFDLDGRLFSIFGDHGMAVSNIPGGGEATAIGVMSSKLAFGWRIIVGGTADFST